MEPTFERNGSSPSHDANRGIDLRLVTEVLGKIAQSQAIEAIKAWRGTTGWGLKESKDAVDALRAFVRTPEDGGNDAENLNDTIVALRAEVSEARKTSSAYRREATALRRRHEEERSLARAAIHWLSSPAS